MNNNDSINDINAKEEQDLQSSESTPETVSDQFGSTPELTQKETSEKTDSGEIEFPTPMVQAAHSKAEKRQNFISGIYDWLEIFVLSATFVILLFSFIMRLAIVDGPSMENTLHDKEMLVISNIFYKPKNNDIIIFNSPRYSEPIVKRVIATEGQTVEIDFDNWEVKVDGELLEEDYIKRMPERMKSYDVDFPLTVPEGYVFVMGDNRNDSLDSRNSAIGLVDERYILGAVKLRLTPLGKFGKVD